MIGRFLEVSLQTSEILESVTFYESLGFRQLQTGDMWTHPYAVVSDGRLHLGLHQYDFESPALTFVLPDLAQHLHAMTRQGIEFAFQKTADDQFNEAGFLDRDGQMIAILEARTYSPAAFARDGFSLLGDFEEYAFPVRDLETGIGFWEPLGFVATARKQQPYPYAELTSDLLNLGLHATPIMRNPELRFCVDGLDGCVEQLNTRGHRVAARGGIVMIDTPDDLPLVVMQRPPPEEE